MYLLCRKLVWCTTVEEAVDQMSWVRIYLDGCDQTGGEEALQGQSHPGPMQGLYLQPP